VRGRDPRQKGDIPTCDKQPVTTTCDTGRDTKSSPRGERTSRSVSVRWHEQRRPILRSPPPRVHHAVVPLRRPGGSSPARPLLQSATMVFPRSFADMKAVGRRYRIAVARRRRSGHAARGAAAPARPEIQSRRWREACQTLDSSLAIGSSLRVWLGAKSALERVLLKKRQARPSLENALLRRDGFAASGSG
jgi:hypothetical protein